MLRAAMLLITAVKTASANSAEAVISPPAASKPVEHKE
jgi:hypothetical protein